MRPVTEDEFGAFARTVELAFGNDISEGQLAHWRRVTELDRTLAVLDGRRMVATAAALSTELTVPGGALPMAAVTAVGVLPSHRRQGLLGRMMRGLVDAARERDEALAGLWASESSIYGRFGYGWSTTCSSLEIATRDSAFRTPVDPRGRVRLVDPEEATRAFPAIHDRVRAQTPGEVRRPAAQWEGWLLEDREDERDGAGPRVLAVLDDRAYAAYRISERWEPAGPDHTLRLIELMAVDAEAEALLWRWLLDVDLVRRLRAEERPPDEPLRLLLADPRRLLRRQYDALWLRALDVVAALEARRYLADGRLVLDLRDAFCEWNTGRYALEVTDGHGICTRTDADADMTLGAEELGAVYLGGTSPLLLHRAGRIDEHRDGAVERAAAMFAWGRLPWCSWEF